jgi:hypothetical protein
VGWIRNQGVYKGYLKPFPAVCDNVCESLCLLVASHGVLRLLGEGHGGLAAELWDTLAPLLHVTNAF